MENKQHYYAKLLLFGEYSILLGSAALSIPYSHFQAELSFLREDKYTDLDQAVESNRMLKEMGDYLFTGWQEAAQILDLEKLRSDLDDGLYLESTIPHGYGLGSSGAVCAALFDRYAVQHTDTAKVQTEADLPKLRGIFSGMESFFHGKSSGIDPLAIFLRTPLYISTEGDLSQVGIPRNWDNRKSGIFLVDSGIAGKTNALVPAFLRKFAPGGQITAEGKTFCQLSNDSIHSLLQGDIPSFWHSLKSLSEFQLKYMDYVIPDSMQPLWKEGLDQGSYYFKICGSGGGGFLTGFAPDYLKAQSELKKKGVQTIPVYLAS